jgi:hypothetical protein
MNHTIEAITWGMLVGGYIVTGVLTSFTAGKYGRVPKLNPRDDILLGLATVVIGVVWPLTWTAWGLLKLGEWVEKNRASLD